MFNIDNDATINGRDFDGFRDQVAEVVRATSVDFVPSDQVVFYHLVTNPEIIERIEDKKPGVLKEAFPVYALSREVVEEDDEADGFHRLPIALLKKNHFTEKQIKEIEEEKLCIKIGSEHFSISEGAYNTLFQRAGLSGLALIRGDYQRNMLLAHSFFSPHRMLGDRSQKVNIVSRKMTTDDGYTYRKVFAFLGKYYKYIPQSILPTLAEDFIKEDLLGKGEVKSWSIDQTKTEILIEFPEAADEIQEAYKLPEKMVPGIYLASSDVGESSVRIMGTLRQKMCRYCVITDEVRRKHSGDVNPEAIAQKAKNRIFANVRVLPETLGELMGVSLKDYSRLDLSVTVDQDKNKSAVTDLYKKVLEKIAKSLSKGLQNNLYDELCSEVDPSKRYSYYDIAITFLELPDRIQGISQRTSAFEDFAKDCAKAPFIVKDLIPKVITSATTPAEDDEDIFLI